MEVYILEKKKIMETVLLILSALLAAAKVFDEGTTK